MYFNYAGWFVKGCTSLQRQCGPLVASSRVCLLTKRRVDCYWRCYWREPIWINVNKLLCILAINSTFIPYGEDALDITKNMCEKLVNLCVKRLGVVLLTVLLAAPLTVYATMEIQELDGNIVRLDEQRGDGKWLLVMLWATDCHICRQQKPEMSRFHDQHKDKDASVLGIALDGMGAVDKVKSYLDEHQPTFPNYVGEIAIVASHYLVLTEESLRGTPTYLLFNPDGELVGNNPGPLSTEAIEKFIASKSAG